MRSYWIRIGLNPITDILVKREEFIYNKGDRDYRGIYKRRRPGISSNH
jgi:hypothetical protein